MFQRILTAWDGSRLALRALDVAIELARRFEADLVAVSIAYSPAHAETHADRAETIDAARRYLTTSFIEVRDRAERAGLIVDHVVIADERPARAILAYAREHSADLIVCGHHQDSFSGRLLLRGTAQELVQVAETPVLVVGMGYSR